MKKLFVMALALFFVTATSGLVLADTPASTNPAASTASGKKSHKGRHHKKGKKTTAAGTIAPAPTK